MFVYIFLSVKALESVLKVQHTKYNSNSFIVINYVISYVVRYRV